MTREESEQILLMLKAAFPRGDHGIDERTAAGRQDLYKSLLVPLHYETAKLAVKGIVSSSAWYPTFAEFREQYDAQNRPRPELVRASSLLLPPPGETTASREEVRAVVAKVSSALAAESDLPIPRHAMPVRESIPDSVRKELDAVKGKLPCP